MRDQETAEKTPTEPRRSDNQKPDDKMSKRVGRSSFDILLGDLDDPLICRGLD